MISCSTCGWRHVERVAGAGVVHVVARVVGDQAVVAGVVDAAEARGWDRGGCPRRCGCRPRRGSPRCRRRCSVLTICLELGDLLAARRRELAIARVRGEEADRVVAPVVAQALLEQVTCRRRRRAPGSSSTAVTPSVLEVGDRRRVRRARRRCRAAPAGRRGGAR